MSEARAVASQLPEAPARLVGDDGAPRFGLYAGTVADASFAGLKGLPGMLQRRLIEKTWQYVFVSTPEMMLALAVIDCGIPRAGSVPSSDRDPAVPGVEELVLPPICARVGETPGTA
jgi:hypothetical protein